ncbi:MAG: hypothetical protein LBR43_01315 [Spiroplasmataceae bacterium]|jgi:hypothetical protein|nr:hypothetical protein [Spiroplasmataceae bacterium]
MSNPINCDKNNPCQSCQEELKQKLAECKVWEAKRKEYIKSWYPFHDEEGNKVKYSETGGYNLETCSKCKKTWEKSNSHGDINSHTCSKNDNNSNREKIQQYFKSNNIKSIQLEDQELIIEYNNSQVERKIANTSELQEIKAYCQAQNLKSLNLSNLEQNYNPSTSPNSNKRLYWGLGIAGVLVLGLISYYFLITKNKEDKG